MRWVSLVEHGAKTRQDLRACRHLRKIQRNNLKEIRLCWAAHVVHHEDQVKDGGLWTPATEEARRDYQIVTEAGNEIYGAGSHWIEERDA